MNHVFDVFVRILVALKWFLLLSTLMLGLKTTSQLVSYFVFVQLSKKRVQRIAPFLAVMKWL